MFKRRNIEQSLIPKDLNITALESRSSLFKRTIHNLRQNTCQRLLEIHSSSAYQSVRLGRRCHHVLRYHGASWF